MKLLFLDRDGCLIREPADEQVDSLEKLELMPDVIPSLQRLKAQSFRFLLVSNQDGLGTSSFPQESFEIPQLAMIQHFEEVGITFDRQFICPHFSSDNCECRKPRVNPDVKTYLQSLPSLDTKKSWMIGDRESDLLFAKNLGINGLQITPEFGWKQIADNILSSLTS